MPEVCCCLSKHTRSYITSECYYYPLLFAHLLKIYSHIFPSSRSLFSSSLLLTPISPLHLSLIFPPCNIRGSTTTFYFPNTATSTPEMTSFSSCLALEVYFSGSLFFHSYVTSLIFHSELITHASTEPRTLVLISCLPGLPFPAALKPISLNFHPVFDPHLLLDRSLRMMTTR